MQAETTIYFVVGGSRSSIVVLTTSRAEFKTRVKESFACLQEVTRIQTL